MTVTWSAIWNTRSMSCSTSSTGISAEMLLTSADALALGHRQAGERLVEQQDARAGAERDAQVQQALPAIGQRARLGLLDAGEPEIARSARRSRR